MNTMLVPGLALLTLLAACSPPQPPATDRPPEPQAAALRDTIRAPLDTARGTQQAVDDAAARQRAAIEAATQ